jgi:N-methylhydantoinase A
VYFPEYGEYRSTPVYDRYTLPTGLRLDGPAIVEERESTLVIGPGARLAVDAGGNLVVSLPG